MSCLTDEIQHIINEFFNIDNFGVKPKTPALSDIDKRAEDILKGTIRKID